MFNIISINSTVQQLHKRIDFFKKCDRKIAHHSSNNTQWFILVSNSIIFVIYMWSQIVQLDSTNII